MKRPSAAREFRLQTASLLDSKPKFAGLGGCFVVLAGLALLDTSLELFTVPLRAADWASLAFTLISVGAPIYAIYLAAHWDWTHLRAIFMIVAGVIGQFGLQIIGGLILRSHHAPLLGALVTNFAVVGLLTWAMGIGALISCLLRDKNMIIPVAIFLAAFDIFLVLTPVGPTHQILTSHPEIIKTIGYPVPTVHSQPHHFAPVVPFVRIGPADFLFLGMFFVLLWRYRMRMKQTLLWVVPVLIGYLFVVAEYGDASIGPFSLSALPALLPIGLVVLIVNRKEWVLSKQEWLATLGVALVGVGLIVFGLSRAPAPKPPAGLSPQAASQVGSGPGATPPPASQGQSPSHSQSVPKSTPGPR